MPKDVLVKIAKEQIRISHDNLGLGVHTKYELLLEQHARAEVFLHQEGLSEKFFEWNARFGVEVELEKKAITKIDLKRMENNGNN